MQTQDNTETCYRRGNQNTWRKTSLRPRPLKPKSIHYYISWSNEYQKHPPSLIYPMYLSPPSSCYQRTSWNFIFTILISRSHNTARLHPPSLTSFFWQIPKASLQHSFVTSTYVFTFG